MSLISSHPSLSTPLILLEGRERLVDTILGDDHHLQPVTDLDVPLYRTCEGVSYQVLNMVLRQRLWDNGLQVVSCPAARLILVLEVDLVVQEWHDERCCRTCCSALLPLVAANRVVGVQCALAVLVQTTQDCVYVVREESLVVEDVAEALRACRHRHGLAVLVLVHLDDGVEVLLQRMAVRSETNHREHYPSALVVWPLTANLEQLGLVSCVDVVARCGSSVAGEDGEVSTRDTERRTTVVGVAVLINLCCKIEFRVTNG
jgi:hypothetical protein